MKKSTTIRAGRRITAKARGDRQCKPYRDALNPTYAVRWVDRMGHSFVVYGDWINASNLLDDLRTASSVKQVKMELAK
jgi:hypothetical protein